MRSAMLLNLSFFLIPPSRFPTYSVLLPVVLPFGSGTTRRIFFDARFCFLPNDVMNLNCLSASMSFRASNQ